MKNKREELELEKLKLFGKALKAFPSSPKQREIHAQIEKVQQQIDDLPPRTIPDKPLTPKRKQTEKPTLLEMYEQEIKQPKLFGEGDL